MTGDAYAALLARTYYHRVTAYRPGEDGEEMVCYREKCALSRSAHTSAPTPPDGNYVLPEAAYRMTLYTLPELHFQLGDRMEVLDTSDRIYHGRVSDSFGYPSHCVAVVEISEISSEPCPDGEEVAQ